MISIDRIHARHAELAALIDQGRLAFADLEVQRDQAICQLAELQRHLDGMAGAKQELDALLESVAPVAERISTYATGLNGVHESALEGEQ